MPVARHPPYRSQACGTTALGSCLRSDAETLNRVYSTHAMGIALLRLFLVLCPVRSKLIPATACWSPSSGHSSPWPKDFSPQTPPVVGRISRLNTFVRSLHRYYSFVRLPKRIHIGHSATGLPRPGRRYSSIGHPWDLPVSVQRACVHAPGL